SDEVRSATWGEFDLDKRLWKVPAERMKANVAHTVPLSDAAVTLLRSLPRTNSYVFAGASGQLGSKIFRETISALKTDTTPHGFRSTFSDWARDRTGFDAETVEHSLAHSVGTKAAQAYKRGTGIEKRRLLMEAWAGYCDGKAEADNVVKMHRA